MNYDLECHLMFLFLLVLQSISRAPYMMLCGDHRVFTMLTCIDEQHGTHLPLL